MTKKPDIVGYKDIADQSGLSVNYLRVMNHRGDMPEADYPNIPAWLQSTVDDWLRVRAEEKGGDKR